MHASCSHCALTRREHQANGPRNVRRERQREADAQTVAHMHVSHSHAVEGSGDVKLSPPHSTLKQLYHCLWGSS